MSGYDNRKKNLQSNKRRHDSNNDEEYQLKDQNQSRRNRRKRQIKRTSKPIVDVVIVDDNGDGIENEMGSGNEDLHLEQNQNNNLSFHQNKRQKIDYSDVQFGRQRSNMSRTRKSYNKDIQKQPQIPAKRQQRTKVNQNEKEYVDDIRNDTDLEMFHTDNYIPLKNIKEIIDNKSSGSNLKRNFQEQQQQGDIDRNPVESNPPLQNHVRVFDLQGNNIEGREVSAQEECGICYQDEFVGNDVKIVACPKKDDPTKNVIYCGKCLNEQIMYSVINKNALEIKCVCTDSCQKIIHKNLFLKIANERQQAEYALQYDKNVSIHIHQEFLRGNWEGKIIRCVAGHCHNIWSTNQMQLDIFKKQNMTKMSCENCMTDQCIACNVVWHEDKNCWQYQAEIRTQDLEADCQVIVDEQFLSMCPYCKQYFEIVRDYPGNKRSCKMRTCYFCKTEFCFICEQQFSNCKCHLYETNGFQLKWLYKDSTKDRHEENQISKINRLKKQREQLLQQVDNKLLHPEGEEQKCSLDLHPTNYEDHFENLNLVTLDNKSQNILKKDETLLQTANSLMAKNNRQDYQQTLYNLLLAKTKYQQPKEDLLDAITIIFASIRIHLKELQNLLCKLTIFVKKFRQGIMSLAPGVICDQDTAITFENVRTSNLEGDVSKTMQYTIKEALCSLASLMFYQQDNMIDWVEFEAKDQMINVFKQT